MAHTYTLTLTSFTYNTFSSTHTKFCVPHLKPFCEKTHVVIGTGRSLKCTNTHSVVSKNDDILAR